MNRIIPCPLCGRSGVEVHETGGGLVVEVCRSCNKNYMRSRSYDKYDKYGRDDPAGYEKILYKEDFDYEDQYNEKLSKERAMYEAVMWNPEPIKVKVPVDPMIAERENLLRILKETGLDQSLDREE